MATEDNKPHVHVEFYTSTKENKTKTAEAGRPIFDDIENVRIKFPADKHSVLVAPANSTGQMRDANTNERLTYAQQYPEHYKAFKEGQEYIGSGTPLKELVFLTESKRQELRALNIHTAEAIAALDGQALGRLGMNARELKTQAEEYIKKADGSADITRLAGENAALKQQMENMQAQLSAMNSTPVPIVTDEVDSNSPFADWDAETLTAYIVEQGGDKPHHKCSLATLIQKADELNANLAKQNEAA